jgi:hypothetical protein
MSHRAVTRYARRQLGGLGDRAAGHQPFGPLMDIAQTLFQTDHGFTVAGEAEMSRLDDAGVDGADRDLVQSRPFHRQERIGLRLAQRIGRIGRQRQADRPAIVIEPGARVHQRQGGDAEQVLRSPLQPDRRGTDPADRGEPAFRAGQRNDADRPGGFVAGSFVAERHVDDPGVGP